MKPPPRRLDQILPNFSYGDAVGNDVQALRKIFLARGAASEIFAQMRHPKVRSLSRYYSEYLLRDSAENACLYHFSIGSPLTEFFARLKARKYLVYHNVTPAEYMSGVNRRAEFECRRGRRELKTLTDRVDLALAVSEFNRRELVEMGFRRTEVLPIAVDFAGYGASPNRVLLRRFDDDWTNVLHVGRFVPNKKLEDILKSFAIFQKMQPRSRLFLVGTDTSFENYSGALKKMAATLGIDGLHMPGHIDFKDLVTYYRIADVYLLMSEHEGFCVPLLESMYFDVPIIAYAAAAVPDTLGNAGILVKEKRHEEIAELISLVTTDGDVKARLTAAGRRRLADFSPEKIEARLTEILSAEGIPL